MIRVASGLAMLSVVSQVIALAALPVITLFFSPEDFNHLAAFSSAALILVTVSALRLEMAIPIVRSESDAQALAQLAAIICVTLAAATAVALWLILPLGGVDPELNQVFWFLPLAVLFGGAQAILLGLAVRCKRLMATGLARVVQTLASIITQIAIGYWAFMQFGLVIGFLVNFLTGAVILFFVARRGGKSGPRPTLAGFRKVAKDQQDYIRYSSFDALLNTSGLQVPLFLISVYGEGAAGGFLFLAIRLFYTPSTIISGAFSKIYHSSIGEALREGRQAQFTQDTLLHLMRYGGGFVIAAILLGPPFVELLMGPEWIPTGQLLAWMAPWIMLQLLASPIATIMMAAHRQRELVVLSGSGSVLRIVSVIVALIVAPDYAVIALALSSLAFYAVCIYKFVAVADLSEKAVMSLVTHSLWVWGAATVVCIVVRAVVHGFI